jgi:hypothetical protein
VYGEVFALWASTVVDVEVSTSAAVAAATVAQVSTRA